MTKFIFCADQSRPVTNMGIMAVIGRGWCFLSKLLVFGQLVHVCALSYLVIAKKKLCHNQWYYVNILQSELVVGGLSLLKLLVFSPGELVVTRVARLGDRKIVFGFGKFVIKKHSRLSHRSEGKGRRTDTLQEYTFSRINIIFKESVVIFSYF